MKISKEEVVSSFSHQHPPIVRIERGTRFQIETRDCFNDELISEKQLPTQLATDGSNPVTGPIVIEGAKRGQTLKVHIHSIQLRDWGVISTFPDDGVLVHRSETEVKIVDITEDTVFFDEETTFPIRPMVGVIGVAPEDGPIDSMYPGNHGGNLDTPVITEGATLYLPIFHDGAYFALGDVHAAMGDGEICGTGVETGAVIDVTIDVVDTSIPRPFVETKDAWYAVAHHDTTDRAIRRAAEDMQTYIVERWEMTPTEAFL